MRSSGARAVIGAGAGVLDIPVPLGGVCRKTLLDSESVLFSVVCLALRDGSSALLLSVIEEDSSSVSCTELAVLGAGVFSSVFASMATCFASKPLALSSSSLGAEKLVKFELES